MLGAYVECSALGLRCDLGELRDGVHVARSAGLGRWNAKLGAAHAAWIVHEDLASTEPHLLVALPNRMLQRVTRRTLIEENRIGEFGLGLRERVRLEHGRHLRRRS